MRLVLQQIGSFIVLVLVQVLILNNIKFLGIINPYLYILFILTLPLSINRGLLLFLAFVLGLSIDIFSNTPGMHAFATVFVAFFRNPIIKLLIPRDDNYELIIPSMKSFGMGQFVRYAVLMVLVHHLILFSVESFSLNALGLLFLRLFFSSIFTLLLVLGIERLRLKK
ncbi:MAG: rod shape-determining protein MreD [Candidatus Cloacimonetes bacterium]|nr:rod shape-determining protein MreD [Candidatus Cloacimonadota bacterium]